MRSTNCVECGGHVPPYQNYYCEDCMAIVMSGRGELKNMGESYMKVELIREFNGDEFVAEVGACVRVHEAEGRTVNVVYKPTFDQKRSAMLYMAFVEIREQ